MKIGIKQLILYVPIFAIVGVYNDNHAMVSRYQQQFTGPIKSASATALRRRIQVQPSRFMSSYALPFAKKAKYPQNMQLLSRRKFSDMNKYLPPLHQYGPVTLENPELLREKILNKQRSAYTLQEDLLPTILSLYQEIDPIILTNTELNDLILMRGLENEKKLIMMRQGLIHDVRDELFPRREKTYSYDNKKEENLQKQIRSAIEEKLSKANLDYKILEKNLNIIEAMLKKLERRYDFFKPKYNEIDRRWESFKKNPTAFKEEKLRQEQKEKQFKSRLDEHFQSKILSEPYLGYSYEEMLPSLSREQEETLKELREYLKNQP